MNCEALHPMPNMAETNFWLFLRRDKSESTNQSGKSAKIIGESAKKEDQSEIINS